MTFRTYTKPQAKPLFKTIKAQFTQSHAATLNLEECLLEPKCSLAHNLFDRSPQQDLVHCNYLLFEYSRSNSHHEVVNLFADIHRTGVLIDGSTLSCVLKACASLFDKMIGIQVHDYCVKSGFLEDVSVGTSLVDMYMKNESVEEGREVFDEMEMRNVVSWTSLLAGYAHNGLNMEALECFFKMQAEGIKPNPFTFATVLGVLADDKAMADQGIQIHTMIIKYGFEATVSVCNSLINMYSKSGVVRNAKTVFDSMVARDSVSWNSMVSGYVVNGLYLEAVEMFYHLRLADVKFSNFVFASVIKSCANIKELGFARQLHTQVIKSGFEFDHNVTVALMTAYSKSREMDDAFKIFSTMHGTRNVVSWTAMINGYLQNGSSEQAVTVFQEMNRDGVRPNDYTYSTILAAQPVVSPLEVHAQIIKSDYQKSASVGTALLDAYVKLRNLDEALKVFKSIDEKDIVAWSAMVGGFAQIGNTEEAVKIFNQMAKEGIEPNEYTFSSIINACASPTASVEQGKQFHAWSIKSRFNDALCVSSALVTLYSKRGDIESAYEVFKRQGMRDIVSWNSMVSGYAQHGHGRRALEVFKEMQKQNMEMDGVTFIGVISACTHAGLVDEGQKYFDIMVKDHHIKPTTEHYSCMVDLYSRAGMLGKATEIINIMPFPADATVWRTLLAASRVYRNLELGKLAAENLISLQPQHSAAYVLLSNIYAAAGNWQERAKVRKLMNDRKVKKEAGYSWIEVKTTTYSFLAGDVSHPMSGEIYAKLAELSSRLKDAGYQPDTNYVLQDVEEEHKETILSQHSERLAIAFGLIATSAGTPLQIVKNLRVCGDCHTVIKLISMMEDRCIVVRDSNRFHHFKGGSCSCGDYW
ncbi:pentatricopeptide repeat-containing protein At2g27610 [Mercurialis annua]|uniref:pentatricopeptide repeat-containing protein At2g27610 n=1 Tax=Mercurialis annua TaxID=3986 RepID=UPI0021607B9B|nr:pentatricopeptide repeat-containing protein At2g27610 [Mercurialis annua]